MRRNDKYHGFVIQELDVLLHISASAVFPDPFVHIACDLRPVAQRSRAGAAVVGGRLGIIQVQQRYRRVGT